MKIFMSRNYDEKQVIERYGIIAQGFILFMLLSAVGYLLIERFQGKVDALSIFTAEVMITSCFMIVRFICKNAFEGFNEMKNPTFIVIFALCGVLICTYEIYQLIFKINNHWFSISNNRYMLPNKCNHILCEELYE